MDYESTIRLTQQKTISGMSHDPTRPLEKIPSLDERGAAQIKACMMKS